MNGRMSIYRTTQQERLERAAREASEWLQTMHAEPSAAERAAFVAWIQASPVHLRELLLARMLESELSDPAIFDGIDVDALLAPATAQGNVVPMREMPRSRGTGQTAKSSRRRRTGKRRFGWARAAMLAGLMLLAGAGAWWGMQRTTPGRVYATAVGEQRSLALDDGSVVTIAPASRIAVDFSHHHRDIWLRSGKADFQVRHDASRPFRVHAGASIVQALGTRFSINRLPSGTVVAVTEGSVKVTAAHASALDDGLSAWLKTWLPANVAAIKTPGGKVMALEGQRHLVAGESAHISDNGRELTLGHLQPARASRTERATRLIFHDDTLADIAAEFNRYGNRTIHVEGQAARLQRYSGVFNADDSDSFLEFLTCCSRLQVSRNGSDVTVREPAPRSTSE